VADKFKEIVLMDFQSNYNLIETSQGIKTTHHTHLASLLQSVREQIQFSADKM